MRRLPARRAGQGFARFNASAQITHDDSARYAFTAYFQLPRATAARGVRDSAVVVDGARVEPSASNLAGIVRYEWRETRPASDPRTGDLVVRGPELADGTAVTLRFPLLARDPASPGTLLLPGEDLRLRILTAAPPQGLERHGMHWMMTVRPSCEDFQDLPLVQLSAQTRVPAEIHVSRSLLPDPLPSPLSACLTAFESYSVPGAPYETFAGVSARLDWDIAP